MAKIISREVHVTVTYTVSVPADVAKTDAEAIEYAKNAVSVPRAWETSANVFEAIHEDPVRRGRGSY